MVAATRARRGRAASKPVEQEPEESAEANGSVREPTRLHELMAEYFNETYDAGVTPLQCAIFTSKRTEFRKSAEYLAYREERETDAEDDERPAKPARSRAKAKEVDEEDAPKPAARRGRSRKPAAAEEEAPAEKPAPARRSRRAGKAEAEEAAPAAEPAKPAARRRRSAKPAAAVSEEEPF